MSSFQVKWRLSLKRQLYVYRLGYGLLHLVITTGGDPQAPPSPFGTPGIKLEQWDWYPPPHGDIYTLATGSLSYSSATARPLRFPVARKHHSLATLGARPASVLESVRSV
jgi:hypothetical protein